MFDGYGIHTLTWDAAGKSGLAGVNGTAYSSLVYGYALMVIDWGGQVGYQMVTQLKFCERPWYTGYDLWV